MKKVNVAVIGFGHLGKWHTEKAYKNENSNLIAIVESFEPNQKAAMELYSGVKVVSNLNEIMEEIDAAVVVTPTSTHYEITKHLLQNGKHVFCEKPLCSNSKEAQDLSNYLNEGQILQVGHSERCHNAWPLIQKDLEAIKGPVTVKINRFAPFKGRATDVDVVQDLMIHDLDLCHYLLKKELVSVKAYGHKIRTDKWDHVTCLIEAKDGSLIEITSGRNHVKEMRSFEVMSNNGCLFVDLFSNEIHKAEGSFTLETGFVKSSQYEKRDHLFIEQDNFYKSIQGKETVMVNYSDGAFIVSLIDKVLESLSTNEKVFL